MQEQLNAEQQIAKLQENLTQGVLQVHTLRSQIEAAEENVKQLQAVIGGIQLGQQFAKEQAEKNFEIAE